MDITNLQDLGLCMVVAGFGMLWVSLIFRLGRWSLPMPIILMLTGAAIYGALAYSQVS
jgi:uncharacterized integral membrane protein